MGAATGGLCGGVAGFFMASSASAQQEPGACSDAESPPQPKKDKSWMRAVRECDEEVILGAAIKVAGETAGRNLENAGEKGGEYARVAGNVGGIMGGTLLMIPVAAAGGLVGALVGVCKNALEAEAKDQSAKKAGADEPAPTPVETHALSDMSMRATSPLQETKCQDLQKRTSHKNQHMHKSRQRRRQPQQVQELQLQQQQQQTQMEQLPLPQLVPKVLPQQQNDQQSQMQQQLYHPPVSYHKSPASSSTFQPMLPPLSEENLPWQGGMRRLR